MQEVPQTKKRVQTRKKDFGYSSPSLSNCKWFKEGLFSYHEGSEVSGVKYGKFRCQAGEQRDACVVMAPRLLSGVKYGKFRCQAGGYVPAPLTTEHWSAFPDLVLYGYEMTATILDVISSHC